MSGFYVKWPPDSSGGASSGSIQFSIGSMDSQAGSINGASVSSSSLFMQSASSIAPGLVNLVAQSFSGTKTFGSGWVSNASVSMSSFKISNLLDPTTAQEAATKNYVDTQLSAFQPLESVAVASTQNIPGTYLNGAAGVGATLTVSSQGAFILDGTSPALLSRVLVKDQSSGLENGVYDLTIVGGVLVSPVLTRSLDYNTPSDIDAGDLIPVVGGVVNQKTSWLQTANVTTVGVDALTFTQYSVSPNNLPSSVGVLNGAAASLNGAAIGSSSLFLQAASAANPGLVSSASQTFAGVKTFNSAPIFNSLTASLPLRLDSTKTLITGSVSLTSEVVGNLPLSQTSGSISLTTQVSGVLPLANTSTIPHQPGGQTSGSISLTQQVSGVLPASFGGTGGTAFVADAVVVGSGTSALKSVSPGSAGNVLKSDGTTWVSGALATSAQAQWNYTAQSSQYSAAINDFVSMSGSSTNVILPDATASGSAGKSVFVYHNGTSFSQVYTFLTTSSQSIVTNDGTSTSGIVAAYTQGEKWMFTSTGTGSVSWIVSQHEAVTPWIVSSMTLIGTTTNPTIGSTTVNNFRKRRNGRNLEFGFNYNQNGTGLSAGTGDYLIPFPANIQADPSVITNGAVLGAAVQTGADIVGNGGINNAGSHQACQVYCGGTTSFKVSVLGATAVWNSATFGVNAVTYFSANGFLQINGWQS